jgi:hypothetical protein
MRDRRGYTKPSLRFQRVTHPYHPQKTPPEYSGSLLQALDYSLENRKELCVVTDPNTLLIGHTLI